MQKSFKNMVEELARKDSVLRKLINTYGILELESRPNDLVFNSLCRSIIAQQLSNIVAKKLISKFEDLFGVPCDLGEINECHTDDLKKIGISLNKAKTIKQLANLILSDSLETNKIHLLDNGEIIDILTSVKGVGVWTAKMFLIFHVGRENVFPIEDKAFSLEIEKLYGSLNNTEQLDLNWSPHQSIAALYLWRNRDEKLISS